MNKTKLKIKEFSLLCGVTVKTLRHYEKIGLLQPSEVDEWTKYRYYNVGQMQTMAFIQNLKAIGYSLNEISDIIHSENLKPTVDSLEQKIHDAEHRLALLQQTCKTLRATIDLQNKILNMENFSIVSLPEIIVASHRQTIKSYNELGRLCCEIIGPEMARLGCKCPEPGYCYTIQHNNFLAENIDLEYCEQVAEMGSDSDLIQFKKIPAVPKAICLKHFGAYDKICNSYLEILKYIEQQNLKICGQPRANYIDGIWNQNDVNNWLTIIQVPIE